MSLFNFGKSAGKSTLGIDVGTAAIKLVELSRAGGRFQLENYALYQLVELDETLAKAGPLSSPQANAIVDQAVAAGLKQVLTMGKFASRDVVASIGSRNTFSTVITMPYLSEQDIAKTIPFEARKYVPVPLDQVVLDWSIINVAPSVGQIIAPTGLAGAPKPPSVEVYIVAVPKAETERYKSIMAGAGLNLRALELENSALIRALIGNDLSPIAVINIGGKSSTIVIVEGGFERVSHNYEVGGAEITQAIARSLKISLERAEELKRSTAAKPENLAMITEAMASLVDLIVFETAKTIHNYEDVKHSQISKILLVGGLANLPAFVSYFQSKLGLPVQLGNPLARLVTPPKLEPLKGELNSTFAIALGLAMRQL